MILHTVHNLDLNDWTPEPGSYHAVLCDPPYEIAFMDRHWDASGIAFSPDFWAKVQTAMLPGAFGMAFSSTRTIHRLMTALETAGFVIHPIIVWAFGSGFPKATRIDTALDRAAGAEVARGRAFNTAGKGDRANEFDGNGRTNVLHEPKTEQAKAWAGHRYGLQALKPAIEPIAVFQKPYAGKPVESMMRTGAGALNIAAGRIQTDEETGRKNRQGSFTSGRCMNPSATPAQDSRGKYDGRWPANLILDADAGAALDKQSGTGSSGNKTEQTTKGRGKTGCHGDFGENPHTSPAYTDAGGASRFFYRVQDTLDNADPFVYAAKSNGTERELGLGPEFAPASNMRVNAPRENELDKTAHKTRNPHPTCKPIDLARHLASLLLPPLPYAPRRLLVPFSGSGSEMIGAALAGWEHIDGIEREREYAEIARARLAHWTAQPDLFKAGATD